MMAEAKATYTTVVIGQAHAEVGLFKTDGDATSTKFDRRIVDAPPPADEAPECTNEADPTAIEDGDPFGDPVEQKPVPVPTKRAVAPRPKYEYGVTMPDGTFVNLDKELERVDEVTRLSGMTIEGTLRLAHLPRIWTREAYYIAPTGLPSSRLLSYVWAGLNGAGAAAVVRFQKRTTQYLGAIVARGDYRHVPHLVLVELVWPANQRPVPDQAKLDMSLVPNEGGLKAVTAMSELSKPPTWVDTLRDEREYQRGVLKARFLEKIQWTSPAKPTVDPVLRALGEDIEAAAAAVL
jgi:hypothetical protein